MPRHLPTLLLLTLPLLTTPGCKTNEGLAALASKSVPHQEYPTDPIALAHIMTVAVLPFDDRASTPGFDGELFATKLANQLGGHGEFRVIFPRDFLALAEKQNRAEQRRQQELQTRQRLGLEMTDAQRQRLAQGPAPRLDPVRNIDQAILLAHGLNADAVITGHALDFDASMRPRMTINFSLTALQNPNPDGDLVNMTRSGVPRGGGSRAHHVVYRRQQVFDAREGNINNSIRAYTNIHVTDNHPNGYRSYLTSMPHYYDICANILAQSLAKAKRDAVKEVERLARAGQRPDGSDPRLEAAARARALEAARHRRDGELADTETLNRPAAHYDRDYPEARRVVDREDARIRSWRADEGHWPLRAADSTERHYRDTATGPDVRDPAGTGYVPDADAMLEGSLLNGRDRDSLWRPSDYDTYNPDKALRRVEGDARRLPAGYE